MESVPGVLNVLPALLFLGVAMRRMLRYGTLFAAMYLTTVTVVYAETGDLWMGLKVAIFTATAKTIIAQLHCWVWDRLDSTPMTKQDAAEAAMSGAQL